MVSFGPETIFYLGPVNITNTVLNTLLVDIILIGGSILVCKKLSEVPSLLQSAIESIIEVFYNLTESVAQTRASRIFPFVSTFFLFILFANWSGLVPGIGTIGFFEDKKLVPILRSATSDLNTTLALALVSAVATHWLSIKTLGIKDYLGRFISLNPMNFFIGILEIISEITKVISLSFRLFGNIFAGEVVLFTVSSIFAFLFPLPFLMLEIVVGFVQAMVFAILTMAFMAILTTPHHEAKIDVEHVDNALEKLKGGDLK